MSSENQNSKARMKRRDFGKTGPLNQLSPAVRAELIRRIEGRETYSEIELWLLKKHGVKTSNAGLSNFRKFHCPPERERATAPMPWEVHVTAPGAQSITIRMVPVDNSRA